MEGVIKKIKDSFTEAVKEHVISMAVFLFAMVLLAISYSDPFGRTAGKVFSCTETVLSCISLAILLCEAFYLYHKDSASDFSENRKKRIVFYAVTVVLTTIVSLAYWFTTNTKVSISLFKENSKLCDNLCRDLFLFVMGTILCLVIRYFYKRSGESFETYVAKAFCGVMKAELVYMIIAVGLLLIILAFNVLIYDTDKFDLLERVQILILGIVQYPCVLVGLSKTENQISKFGKVVLSYVFTGLLAVAFVIIYVYIIKILVKWSFPSNEVFSILTALFAFGVVIWTMAQGCCDEALVKPFKVLPFLFVPFIVLQGMCLFMRVNDYGYTTSRYLGLALIIFEIAYFILYTVKTIAKKDMMVGSLFLIITAMFVVLLMPGLNMYSVITASQSKRIEKYLAMGEGAESKDKKSLYQAYKTIKDDGGFSGKKFIEKKLTSEEKELIQSYSSENGTDYSQSFYINASSDMKKVDISGCQNLYFVNSSAGKYSYTEVHGDELVKLSLYSGDEEIGVADLTVVTRELLNLYDQELHYDEKYTSEVLNKEIPVMGGGKLIIRDITLTGDSDEKKVTGVILSGYVIK